jgi:hypothetical protein
VAGGVEFFELATQGLELGRVIARVIANPGTEREVDVGATLLREGFARLLGLDLAGRDLEELKALEQEARAAQRGLWGLPHPLSGPAPPPFAYCAASHSGVFHAVANGRVDCPMGNRISPANFQGYRTLEEVRATGRQPCRVCLARLAGEGKTPPAQDLPEEGE